MIITEPGNALVLNSFSSLAAREVVKMTKLAASQVVKITTLGVVTEKKLIEMMLFLFQRLTLSYNHANLYSCVNISDERASLMRSAWMNSLIEAEWRIYASVN